MVTALKDKGIKAHLVLRTERGTYPPPHQIKEMRAEGMWWCPYCRAWRWFAVPKFKPRSEINTEEWYLNSYHRQGIKVCQWCHIGETDFYVRKVNGTWAESMQRRRRRKKRTR